LAVLITAANVNDYAYLLPLLDQASGGRPGELRAVLADRGYDSRSVREGISERGFDPQISERNKRGQGRRRDPANRQRSTIERTFAWLNGMRRLATRWERRPDLYLAFLLLGCAILTYRRLTKPF
jgi:transposase